MGDTEKGVGLLGELVAMKRPEQVARLQQLCDELTAERAAHAATKERDRLQTPQCKHEHVGRGPRLPLVYGSAPTEVCLACGVWRDSREHVAYRPAIKWRQAAELLIDIARGWDDE